MCNVLDNALDEMQAVNLCTIIKHKTFMFHSLLEVDRVILYKHSVQRKVRNVCRENETVIPFYLKLGSKWLLYLCVRPKFVKH